MRAMGHVDVPPEQYEALLATEYTDKELRQTTRMIRGHFGRLMCRNLGETGLALATQMRLHDFGEAATSIFPRPLNEAKHTPQWLGIQAYFLDGDIQEYIEQGAQQTEAFLDEQ